MWESEDIHLIAQTASERLAMILPLLDEHIEERRLELVDELQDLANDPDADARDFDYVWNDLYDWADTPLDANWNGKKVCWIKMF